jgi:hypothetical protein
MARNCSRARFSSGEMTPACKQLVWNRAECLMLADRAQEQRAAHIRLAAQLNPGAARSGVGPIIGKDDKLFRVETLTLDGSRRHALKKRVCVDLCGLIQTGRQFANSRPKKRVAVSAHG